MIAFFLLSYAFGGPAIAEIRWATFVTLGLAPVVLLIGVLHDRLGRSAVGELFLELRADPAPADLHDALARALRDPSLILAYWLPEFGSYADHDGRPVEVPNREGRRAMRLIDRDGRRVAALLHDPALEDEPELLTAVTAAAGIALENARLMSSCELASKNCVARARELSRPASASGNDWSAISTTVRSTGWLRCRCS